MLLTRRPVISRPLEENRSQEVQFHVLQSELINFALDGKRIGKDIYKLILNVFPLSKSLFVKQNCLCLPTN